jgi:phosphoribosylformylglycinamidine synthase
MTGTTGIHFAGSHLDEVVDSADVATGSVPEPDADAPRRYRSLHRCIRAGLIKACHDIAEGGLAVAVAEMCIAGRLGVALTDLGHQDTTTALFSESCGRHVIELSPADLDHVRAEIGSLTVLGTVSDDDTMTFPDGTTIAVADLVAAHTGRHKAAP